MAELTVYEKRTCTTCKNLATLLEERGIDFERVDYHVEPLTEAQIRELVRKTGRPARDLFRTSEPVYEEHHLADREPDADEAIALRAAHPELLWLLDAPETMGAVLGRPVERVLELLAD